MWWHGLRLVTAGMKLQRLGKAIVLLTPRYRDNSSICGTLCVRRSADHRRWRHEHIINIYYADDEDGLYYFAMEYIDVAGLGQLLAPVWAKGQLMPQAEVLRIGRTVASAPWIMPEARESFTAM